MHLDGEVHSAQCSLSINSFEVPYVCFFVLQLVGRRKKVWLRALSTVTSSNISIRSPNVMGINRTRTSLIVSYYIGIYHRKV